MYGQDRDELQLPMDPQLGFLFGERLPQSTVVLPFLVFENNDNRRTLTAMVRIAPSRQMWGTSGCPRMAYTSAKSRNRKRN
jgi:hypothetical protein